MRRALALAVTCATIGGTRVASAAEPVEAKAVFAIVVGSNRSVDADQAPLRYADDDATQYFDLFRALGARAYLLTRADDNTRRLHPQAIAEAALPRERDFDNTIAQAAADVAKARAAHVRTVLYFIYAGHGNVKNGEGYLALEDARLNGRDLERRVIDLVSADEAHLIIDACYSFFLTYSRGPGGERRPLAGFTQLAGLARRESVGLLLSTSSARESHEWEAFQGGVFSHEVRSGLYGAADADGDGQVSYREIAAFVQRANAAIPNDRYRPDVYARPPRESGQLLDLRAGFTRRLEVEEHAHFLLEDAHGVRLADFHGGDKGVRLLRPLALGPLFLRRADGEVEYAVPANPDVIRLAELRPAVTRVRERGAAHEAFSTLFSLPFDAEVVTSFRLPPPPDFRAMERAQRRLAVQHGVAYGGFALGGAALASAVALSLSARSLADVGAGASQVEVDRHNQQAAQRNVAAAVLYGATGALALTSALLLVLPRKLHGLSAVVTPGRSAVSFTTSF